MKTACEEAALMCDLSAEVYRGKVREIYVERAKRLRSEARELKALRRIALNADSEPAYLTIKALIRIAKRIQKARKAK